MGSMTYIVGRRTVSFPLTFLLHGPCMVPNIGSNEFKHDLGSFGNCSHKLYSLSQVHDKCMQFSFFDDSYHLAIHWNFDSLSLAILGQVATELQLPAVTLSAPGVVETAGLLGLEPSMLQAGYLSVCQSACISVGSQVYSVILLDWF